MVEQVAQMVVHGEAWTIKDLFVLPNEYVYWSIQIVMYPLHDRSGSRRLCAFLSLPRLQRRKTEGDRPLRPGLLLSPCSRSR